MRGRRRRGGGPRSQQQPILTIETLGAFAIRGTHGDVSIATRKAAALIGYLALSDDGAESRERLVGLLWSETDEEKARASLRQALHGLREVFEAAGSSGLRTDKVSVALDHSAVRVDLWDVLEAAKAGRAHPLVVERSRLIDSLLRDFETVDEAFRIWLLAKRQALHDRLVRLLELAMRASEATGKGREELAEALLNLDPTHEEAARLRIRARAADGDIGAALRIYKDLWDLLEKEYDIEPSEETRTLIASLRMEQRPARDQPPALASAAPEAPAILPPAPAVPQRADVKPMIAIQPFELTSTTPEDHYLVHGFRRELIACLVRFREWFVQEPATAAASGPAEDYRIEATAFQTADAVRLVLTLRDMHSNRYLWSERIRMSMANWFDAQQVIVRRLATALNVHLSAERLVHLAHLPGNDLRAYDLWLQGQAMVLSFSPYTWETAAQLFREAIARAPTFAPAYSSLAQIYNGMHLTLPGISRDRHSVEQALSYAREAGRLDPIDSRSQLCLGWAHAMAKLYEQAEIYLRLANELNENDPWTMISSANCFAFCGARDRAHELAAYALGLPLVPSPVQWAYHAAIRFLAGDYEGCVAAAELAGDANPNVPGYKAAALHHLGLHDAAAAEVRHFFASIRARWFGKEPASDDAITRWFLHLFPIRRPDDWQRLRDGFVGAGAPANDLKHHGW